MLNIRMQDYTRATDLTPEVEAAIEDAFAYHAPNEAQVAAMQKVRDALCAATKVRDALCAATKVIVAHVPPGPDRSVALREIRSARMNGNSGIIFGGKL